MGLTGAACGKNARDAALVIRKKEPEDKVVALAGNPNVGKSTVFNALTGMRQHTGNWPGKTVSNAQGRAQWEGEGYVLVDIPGCYSLLAHSAEEEVARDFICFGSPDAAVVVCDATCLERNLNLALQIMEVCPKTVVCVNLLDEAARKKVTVDLNGLSRRLGVPVVGTSARDKKGLDTLLSAVASLEQMPPQPAPLAYPEYMEKALAVLEPALREKCGRRLPSRWLALRLLEGEESILSAAEGFLQWDLCRDPAVEEARKEALAVLEEQGMAAEEIRDTVTKALLGRAEEICRETVRSQTPGYSIRDRRLDRFFTSRATGFPVMIALLAVVFWLTIAGANLPSQYLSAGLFWLEEKLAESFLRLGGSPFWCGLLIHGGYRTLAWVVSVMLPPMAIFFPLFTLLEDLGYLPRVAFNLDHAFSKCSACGKQSLCMCMGFGCNAAGVVGCRIIDSPRERLIAIITNSFVPCNGRFPILIALLSMFFVTAAAGPLQWAGSALMLTGLVLLGVTATLLASKILSKTMLKGVPSSFSLELPPYRRPKTGQVIVRSVLDRTLFVLGRAAAVAFPAGVLIWLMANVAVGGQSVLAACAGALDPFARLLGMDGVILLAFVLGLPANEIVMPIIIMSYLSGGNLVQMDDLGALRLLLTANGWDWATAVSVALFSLFHWPCSTTCLTIFKETKSVKWTIVSVLAPTFLGIALCFLFHLAVSFF